MALCILVWVLAVSIKLSLSELTPGQASDEWHVLSAANPASSKGPGEAGSLRASVRYLHEVIMPIKEYASLKELLVGKDLETVKSLCAACANDRVPLANALLQIFRHERHEAHLLKTLNEIDIDAEGEAPPLLSPSLSQP